MVKDCQKPGSVKKSQVTCVQHLEHLGQSWYQGMIQNGMTCGERPKLRKCLARKHGENFGTYLHDQRGLVGR